MNPRSRAVVGFVVACAATWSSPSRADEPVSPTALDETTFLQRVRERSPRTRALEERARAASADVGVAGVLPNPTVSYEREAVPSLQNVDNFFRLGWTLDLAGRRGLAMRAARAGADAERADVTREQAALVAEARLAYLDAVYARERLARLDAGRVGLSGLVDMLQSRAKQGETSGYDADRAALELATLDDDRATATRELALAQLRLGAFIGEPATPYAASGALALPVAPPVLDPQRREIDVARARAAQADAEVSAAKRRWVPRLELLGGMMVSTQTNGDGIGYVVGIGGELPVFDRGGAAASRARANAKRWRAEVNALGVEVRGEVVRARRELELLITQATTYAAGPVTRAADLERRAAAAYREGDRPILELLDVQRTTRQVALRALELVYEACRADIALGRALGRTP